MRSPVPCRGERTVGQRGEGDEQPRQRTSPAAAATAAATIRGRAAAAGDIIVDDGAGRTGCPQGGSDGRRQGDLEGLISFDFTVAGDIHRDFAPGPASRDDKRATRRDEIDSGGCTESSDGPLAGHLTVR